MRFTQQNIDDIYEILTANDNELKLYFNSYLENEYKVATDEKLSYLDIAEISRYIVSNLEKGQTEYFDSFFKAVEIVLNDCDGFVENLIIVGLFETIQNTCGRRINYYTGFNKWLNPVSKLKWDELIDYWEGKGWRKTKIKNK